MNYLCFDITGARSMVNRCK